MQGVSRGQVLCKQHDDSSVMSGRELLSCDDEVWISVWLSVRNIQRVHGSVFVISEHHVYGGFVLWVCGSDGSDGTL